jgi:hypothetical protein
MKQKQSQTRARYLWHTVLMGLGVFVCVGSLIVLAINEGKRPFESGTIVAKIDYKQHWIVIQKRTTREIYRLDLVEDDREFTCDTYSQEVIQEWSELEIGQVYEFSVRYKSGECFIDTAVPVDAW